MGEPQDHDWQRFVVLLSCVPSESERMSHPLSITGNIRCPSERLSLLFCLKNYNTVRRKTKHLEAVICEDYIEKINKFQLHLGLKLEAGTWKIIFIFMKS